MITIEKAKEICRKKRLVDIEMLEVIERYIYDKKGVIVDIDRPMDLMSIQLMNVAFDSACNYYLNELNNG